MIWTKQRKQEGSGEINKNDNERQMTRRKKRSETRAQINILFGTPGNTKFLNIPHVNTQTDSRHSPHGALHLPSLLPMG